MNSDKNNRRNFILKLVDLTYKFLSKMRCSCCVSNCVIEKNCPEPKQVNDNE